MTPDQVAAAITEALNAGDVQAVKALTTAAGWVKGGSSVRAMAEASAERPPPPMRAFGSIVEGDRAAVGLVVELEGRVVGKVWMLCQRVDGGWKAAGTTLVAPQAGLFLDEVLPAMWDWRSKPPSALGHEWAEDLIADLVAGRMPAEARTARLRKGISTLIIAGIESGRVLRSYELDELDRALVTLSLRSGDEDHERAVVLEIVDEEALPLSLTEVPSAAGVFIGITWDREVDGEPEVATGH